MPKSHDDPDEIDDPAERHRLAREAWERREARRTHPGSEDTDRPPPIKSPWPATARVDSAFGSPSAVSNPPPHVRRLGNWGKYIAGMVAGAAALYTVGHPVVTWIGSRASIDDVATMKRTCESAAAASANAASVPLAQRIAELETEKRKNDGRWNALDKWHQKNFQRRNAPAIDQFGPKAESRGNATTVKDLDSP